jgi:hypothetical protein
MVSAREQTFSPISVLICALACRERICASAQGLDFLAIRKNCSFPNRKQTKMAGTTGLALTGPIPHPIISAILMP